MSDQYRILNPTKRVYTWRKNSVTQGRLDYNLVSEHFTNITKNFVIKSGYRSSYSEVIIDLRFDSFERGSQSGLWNLINNLPHDKSEAKNQAV